MVYVGQLILDNWDDIRAFGILVFDEIAGAVQDMVNGFGEFADDLFEFFVQPFIDAGRTIERIFDELIAWIEKKLRRIGELGQEALDFLNPFNVNDTSTSGVRGVGPDTPSVAMIRGLGGNAIGDLPGPQLVERGNGSAVAITNSPQFTVYQQPGEDSDKFAKRVAQINSEELQRTNREAQGGIL